MKELIRSTLPDLYKIQKLQNCILNIAKYIHDFCVENNITYCLMGGSALGAVRHKGFIPWDDDLDIFMRPQDYEKFRKLFLEKGNHKVFYLQEWGSKNGFPSIAKLRLNRSTYIEETLKDLDTHQGVFVDIFILHTCPNNIMKRYNQYFWCKYLVVKSLANKPSYRKCGISGLLVNVMKVFPKRFLVNYALSQVYKYTDEDSEYLCHFLGRALLKTGLYKRSYFNTVKKVPFENIELYVPHKVEEYLSDRWGDYMKLPSEDEIKYYQHCKSWSINESLWNYKVDGNYLDEKYLIT